MSEPVRLLIAVPPLDEEVDDLFRSLGTANRRVVVVLADPLVQRRRLLDLPPGRRSMIRNLVARHCARYFRVRDDGVVVDLVSESAHPGATWLAVAVSAGLVDLLLKATRRLSYEIVDIIPESRAGWSGLSFMPAVEWRRRLAQHWRRTAYVAASVLFLLGTVWAASSLARLLSLQRLSRDLSSVDSLISAVTDAQVAYMALSELTATIQRAEQDRRRLGGLMTAVVGALPDSAVLTTLALDLAGRGRMAGFAEEALAVNAALRRIPELGEFQLEGTPTIEAIGNRSWMRFALRSTRP